MGRHCAQGRTHTGKIPTLPKTVYRVLTLAPEFPDSAQAWSGCGHGKDPTGLRWGEHKHRSRRTLPDCRPSEEPQEHNLRAHKHRGGSRSTGAQKGGTPQPRAQHSRRPRPSHKTTEAPVSTQGALPLWGPETTNPLTVHSGGFSSPPPASGP